VPISIASAARGGFREQWLRIKETAMKDQVWIAILTDDGLVQRVARELVNRHLFGDDPEGYGKKYKRMDCVFRPTSGDLGDIVDPKKPWLPAKPPFRRHVVLSVGERIVAVAGLRVYPDEKKKLCVTHVSVESDYCERGFARAIIAATYGYARQHRKMVDPSSFSPMGKDRIAHIFRELNGRYPQAAYIENRHDGVSLDPASATGHSASP
jgi:hypothetical protein